MHQRDAEPWVVMQDRTGLQPVEQGLAIGRVEHRLETSIASLERGVAAGHGEQVQVVVAEYDDGRVTERLDTAQYGERVGSPVYEVSDEPQPVSSCVEVDFREQRLQFERAALHVADGVDRHGRVSAACRAWRA